MGPTLNLKRFSNLPRKNGPKKVSFIADILWDSELGIHHTAPWLMLIGEG